MTNRPFVLVYMLYLRVISNAVINVIELFLKA
jgi:hypothetical protein